MIGKLTGRFGGTTSDGAVLIEVGGVGYVARVPLFSLDTLRLRAMEEISLFIHTRVAEDALDLYGFPTEDELLFFKQLMSVSGIGPKTALGILNISDVATLRRAIAAGDAAALTKVFGIGKKSAERLVVELRDKLALEQTSRGESVQGSGGDSEVIEALTALGYSLQEARGALKHIGAVPSLGVNERISRALKALGTRAATS
ncbi:MAG TPA: Holliday junction branch migration protein RuvA [Candidatus Paceibacterota bacterium]